MSNSQKRYPLTPTIICSKNNNNPRMAKVANHDIKPPKETPHTKPTMTIKKNHQNKENNLVLAESGCSPTLTYHTWA